jgi:hypothetical protein
MSNKRKEDQRMKAQRKLKRLEDNNGTSKYAEKKRQQKRGRYSESSPFYSGE